MTLKKRLLQRSTLYGITDLEALAQALCGPYVGVVQLRDKESPDALLFRKAAAMQEACSRKGTLFILNDRPDIAAIAGCDGCHIGQDDVPLHLARKIMGPEAIIGVSCHSLAHARAAQQGGADYIGIGPVFATTTKRDAKPIPLGFLDEVWRMIRIPVFAIGGITLRNLAQVQGMGFTRVAVSRALCNVTNPRAAARAFAQGLKGHTHS